MNSSHARRVAVSLHDLAGHVARCYHLGEVASWEVLTTGYEDCNLELRAAGGWVVVKVFPRSRGYLAARTAALISSAQAAGVRHPRLHLDQAGSPVHAYQGHQLIVMDFDPGRSLYQLGRAPDAAELAAVLAQAALIHQVDACPPFVLDPWAITNLVPMAASAGTALTDPQLRQLVSRAIEETGRVDRSALPVTLIHGDLTKGNVLLSPGPEVTVLDFAVANRYPRIQELAVIAANLTHGAPEPLPARVEQVAALYSSTAPVALNGVERDALRAFALAAAAMELLGALAEQLHGDNSSETSYLVTVGEAGLRDYL